MGPSQVPNASPHLWKASCRVGAGLIITIRPIELLNIPLRSNVKPFRTSLHILTFQMRTKLLVLTTLAGGGVSWYYASVNT